MKLERSVALVTGGARRLGYGIAQGLARAGCDVVVHYGRSQAEAERAVANLSAMGVRAWSCSADLTDPRAIDRLFDFVRDRAGHLDLLVNSAASFESAPIAEIGVEAWDRVLALNLRAPFLCLQRASQLMRTKQRDPAESAAVVNIADWSGLQPWVGFAHHGVSKAGLVHLTRIAARELAPDIRVNAIVPGAILPAPGVDPESAEWQERSSRIPRGRTGETQDVAKAVLFLAEHEFLTGAVLPVDGGEGLC